MAVGRNEDTPWQQGFVLTAESAVILGLVEDAAKYDQIVLLVSHDCDLVEDSNIEPSCEVIVGKKIEKIDGTFAGAKNPRRLHLEFTAGETRIAAEFFAADKRQIKKDLILAQSPNTKVKLSQDQHFTLQTWLSVRYHRAIFPDEFDRRLKARPAEVHKRLANTIKSTGADLVAVLFDLDGGKDVQHDGPDDPYALTIFLIYRVSVDPARAEAIAIKAAQSIRGIFRKHYFSPSRWQNIELRDCVAISEEALTLYHFRCLKPWYFDYLDAIAEDKKPDATLLPSV